MSPKSANSLTISHKNQENWPKTLVLNLAGGV